MLISTSLNRIDGVHSVGSKRLRAVRLARQRSTQRRRAGQSFQAGPEKLLCCRQQETARPPVGNRASLLAMRISSRIGPKVSLFLMMYCPGSRVKDVLNGLICLSHVPL